jgi:hypothetical protein
MFKVRKLERKDTAPYTFAGLSLDPEKPIVLHTRPLSLETREVFNAAFEAVEPDDTKPADKFDERMLGRAKDLRKLARACVASWENVTEMVDGVDDDGMKIKREQPLECTPDNAERFLNFLDNEGGWREEVTAYIQWAFNRRNFREPLVAPDGVGKG